ncbi:MAG: DUF5687 family protein [Bacteroidetes bacterium]|nr:DUF5687 family protein [Bacteroidota bacterium]
MNTLSLFFRLAGHQWKEAIRSSYWQKTVLINIILGIFLLYFLINLIVLGFFLGKILVSAFPGTEPVSALSGILLYYFIADFLLRFFMQPAPVISVVPYLHLPVRKNSIFHFLLIKSGFSLFNFFPVVVLLPFTLRYIIPVHAAGLGLAWIFTIILLIFSSNYLAFFIKKLFSAKPAVIIALAVVTAIVAWVDFSHDRAIALRFGDSLMYVALHPAWIIAPVIILFLSYGLSWLFLHRQRYMEVKEKQEKQYASAGRTRHLAEIFGVTGTLVSLEMKMILRNNRPRSYLVLSALFMFYGFMIYPKLPVSGGFGMMLFIGLLLTGIMMVQYGQLILSWESSYFDRLCTANFSSHDYFTSKYWLFFLFNTVTFVVTLPYALYDYRILPVNLAAWLFNCGINIFLILYLGSYNTKRVDMSKGAFFNYEGVTAVHFFMILPVFGLPILISWLVSNIVSDAAGVLAIGLTGLAGIIFHRQLINIVTRQFLARKQNILQGFRNG